MKFIPTKFNTSFIIEIEPHRDERGFFARTFCAEEFRKHGLRDNMVQTNLSFSKEKFTLRGMHYQVNGAEEAKLVRCNSGAILDVIIDIRENSSTFGQYLSVELTPSNLRMLYVPEGFAHGFLTLESNSLVSYQVSNFYSPGKERGIRWDDPVFNINWPISSPSVISLKDSQWEDYQVTV
jgi:dTDP-4-dehydrorhamnose 3,5-epimerase